MARQAPQKERSRALALYFSGVSHAGAVGRSILFVATKLLFLRVWRAVSTLTFVMAHPCGGLGRAARKQGRVAA